MFLIVLEFDYCILSYVLESMAVFLKILLCISPLSCDHTNCRQVLCKPEVDRGCMADVMKVYNVMLMYEGKGGCPIYRKKCQINLSGPLRPLFICNLYVL